jgi:DNA-binding MarR family transcriptional regulator
MAHDDLGRMLLGAFRAFEVDVIEAFAERELDDLRPSYASVYAHVRAEGSRLSDLARAASMTKQGMADIVREMQDAGLVRRAPDPEDGRAVLVVLTAKGRRRLTQASRAIERVEGRVRRRLGERRYEALRTALADLSSSA